ncbi:ganglioside GM2 activator [Rhinophrynus dorsalis]
MAHLSLWILVSCAALGQFTSEAARLNPNWIPWELTKLNDFSWSNCDGGSLPGQIKSLSVRPDPITIPGTVTVSTVLSTTVPLESPLKISIIAEKELLGEWLKVPCVDNIGSCTYDHICDLLDDLIPPGQECPEPLRTYDLPCHCPIKAGSYSLPETDIEIPNIYLPSWLTNGNYRVTGTLIKGDKEIGCAKLTFSMKSSSWWW